MIQINLLPDLILNRRREQAQIRLVKRVFIVFIVFLFGLSLVVFGYRYFRQVQLVRTQQAYQKLYAQVYSDDNVRFREEALAVQRALASLSVLFAAERPSSAFLTQVSFYTINGIRISNLSLDEGNQVQIEGSAMSYQTLGQFLLKLKAEGDAAPVFDSVVLTGANLGDIESPIRFSISARYNSQNVSTAGAQSNIVQVGVTR